jgi:hypothetical protein
MKELKQLIKENLTDTTLIKFRGLVLLSMTCFWSKINFSAILKYYGVKYYCYFDNNNNDISIKQI